MKRRAGVGPAALCLLVVCGIASGAAAQAPKTLARFHDPVVLSTSQLAGLPDRRTEALRLYRVEHGIAAPIPFQVDALDRNGEIEFTEGGAPTDFAFDDNDELIFMAKDSGDRAADDALPGSADAALEIEIADPVDGGLGWVYLAHFSSHPPPPSPARYVAYDRAANRAHSSFYTVDYDRTHNFFTAMRIDPSAGGNGDNLLRRTRMRGNPTFSLLLTRWSPVFTEQNSIVAVEGIKDGPVRVVRRIRLSVDLGEHFPDLPSGTVTTYHYLSSFTTPTQFGVPWMALKMLRDFRFENVLDFRPEVLGSEYWDGSHPDGLRFTGGHRSVLASRDHDWWVASGPLGTWLSAFLIPEQWKTWGIARGTVFRDDGAAREAGGRGVYAAGFSLLNMTNLRRSGSYGLLQATVVLSRPYQPGDEAAPMAMLQQPLLARVRAARPAGPARTAALP